MFRCDSRTLSRCDLFQGVKPGLHAMQETIHFKTGSLETCAEPFINKVHSIWSWDLLEFTDAGLYSRQGLEIACQKLPFKN